MLCIIFVYAVNPCCSFPCENNGVCVDDADKYTCDCTRTGYYGNNCDICEYIIVVTFNLLYFVKAILLTY